MLQAGKTAFNQSTLILIILVSFAVWCPRFETEETENKHSAPGKENTDEFTPFCLSVWVCTMFSPCRNTTHSPPPHSHTLTGQIWGANSLQCRLFTCVLQHLPHEMEDKTFYKPRKWTDFLCKKKKSCFTHKSVHDLLATVRSAMWGVVVRLWPCVDTVQASLQPSLSILLQL